MSSRPALVALLSALALVVSKLAIEQFVDRHVTGAAVDGRGAGNAGEIASANVARLRGKTSRVVYHAPESAMVSDVTALSPSTATESASPYSIGIHEVGPGFYEVSTADAQALLDVAGRSLPSIARGIRPAFSFDEGLQYRIRSEFVDGVLTTEGFTATDPKLVAQAGIEAGDIIVSVNGRPVDGLASSYAIFVEVLGDPAQRAIEVTLRREGAQLTQTYWLR